MSLNKLFTVAFVLFLTIFAQQNAFACSCARTPALLYSFENSEQVIVGRVVSLETKSEYRGKPEITEETDLSNLYIHKSIKIAVEKVYKGSVKVGDELTFAQGQGGNCIWAFGKEMIGEKFLFYLDPPSKRIPFSNDAEAEKDAPLMYSVSECGRSRSVKNAVGDLAYLDNIDKFRGKTRVSGTFKSWSDYAPNFAEIPVKIIGKNKTVNLKIDKNGFFEIYDLPAGEYFIETKVPYGWKLDDMEHDGLPDSPLLDDPNLAKNRVRAAFKEKGHAEANLLFSIDNEIRGKILSPSGKPMKDVRISAISASSKEDKYDGKQDSTDEKGEFLISKLPPDTYILVVNNDGKIDDTENFGRLFYPGVSERAKASVVSIEAGKFLKGIDIQIPQTVELVEINGQLLFEDGKPVVERNVVFNPEDLESFNTIRSSTDSQGRFTIKIPKGAKGKLFGENYYYGEFVKTCPKLAEIIMETRSNTVKTQEINIDFESEIPQNVKLLLPFPECKKE